jgi:uncharacterized membrane protein (UPF0182 family)
MSDDVTVTEAADALGTSPQTVRTLLRNGELRGRKQPRGRRLVWVPSRKGVDEFLSQYGRLDGRRRTRPPRVERLGEAAETVPLAGPVDAPSTSVPRARASPRPDPFRYDEAHAGPARRPFFLRPRGRATVAVVVLGLPLLLAYESAQILPDALWFDELGQLDVFRRIAAAKVELYLAVAGSVSFFIGANLVVAVSRTKIARTRAVTLAVVAASLVTATFFASSAAGHWQTFLLWRHRQPFGVADPIFGKDVGFFIFSLPFQLVVSGLLLWLIAVAAASVALVYRARGALRFRPPHAKHDAQVHLAALAAAFLLVVAWRLRLGQYALELGQPSPADSGSFAGAGYVDVHVRSPGLTALRILAIVLALACVMAPHLGRRGYRRRARLSIGVPAAGLLVAMVSVGSWLPALVQRFAVNPNPLVSEQPFLKRSMAATRSGLGLEGIDVHPYSPTSSLTAADISRARPKLANVQTWDRGVIQARMRDLVTETPYYSAEKPTLDIVRVDGRRRPTLASARELDLHRVRGSGRSWASDRLAYTHGVGLPRFSATDIKPNGQPRLLDAGLRIRQPRIYFGDLPAKSPGWALVDTRRPEVDIPASDAEDATEYHYDGTAGVALSSWIHRAMFALKLRSKDLLISDEITPESRIVLHRDVHDRLTTLAPFIRWDAHPAPLAVNGRIVFVVDGYTTSENFPYAERVELGGGASVNYARASVRATVDAFSGQVDLYLTGESDPIARAWAQAFPTLFRPPEEMPAQFRDRLRYPADLFEAQANAYERFHTTRPDLFASGSDVWSPPTSLSGSVDVGGDIQFDEDDEDNLRHPAQPEYKFSPPPGQRRPRLVLSSNYSPRRGQNLVASLDGWVDERGRAHLASRILPPDPITLGPAQISRLVFSTPRVSNLLGLTNLELRDLDKSSIDTVSLGKPHLVFLPRGIVQIQSLYKGANGPGVSRIIGATAFLNGRAGVGPDVEAAVRHALHEPPRLQVQRPSERPVVGTPVKLRFRVKNAQREVMTITSSAGRQVAKRALEAGSGTVDWVPSAPGHARVRVKVEGLDGSTVAGSTAFRVLSPPPTIRLTTGPTRAVVGRPVRFSFEAADALDELAQISTRGGTLTRRYLIRNDTGFIEWTPQTAGPAVVHIRARGRQGQTADDTAKLTVARGPRVAAPTATLLQVPDVATVGSASEIAFEVTRSRVAVARIAGDGGEVRVWRFVRPTGRVGFAWTPTRPGAYRLTIGAQGSDGTTTQAATRLTVERAR